MMSKIFRTLFLLVIAAKLSYGQTGNLGDTTGINKLNAFNGKWLSTSESKDSPYSKSGHTTATTICNWSPDHNFLVCNQVVQKDGMTIHDLAIFSYDDAKHRFIYAEMDNHGNINTANLDINGNAWIYSDEYTQEGKQMKVKVTNLFVKPDQVKFKVEVSDDGGKNWIITIEGEENRIEQ